MPSLVKISKDVPNAVQIWGFHDPVDITIVSAAVKHIAGLLTGTNNTIHIMSGTHGYCGNSSGMVATREQKFADEDGTILHPKTSDGKTVKLVVHDFNTNHLISDGITAAEAATAKLNKDMRDIISKSKTENVFLLAYCCSAGKR